MLRDDDYILMRCKIDEVFEHYAAQSEYYKRANIVQRLKMEDAFYVAQLQKLFGSTACAPLD
jgi:hypothetical protein